MTRVGGGGDEGGGTHLTFGVTKLVSCIFSSLLWNNFFWMTERCKGAVFALEGKITTFKQDLLT